MADVPVDGDLAKVVARWPSLPQAARKRILEVMQTSGGAVRERAFMLPLSGPIPLMIPRGDDGRDGDGRAAPGVPALGAPGAGPSGRQRGDEAGVQP